MNVWEKEVKGVYTQKIDANIKLVVLTPSLTEPRGQCQIDVQASDEEVRQYFHYQSVQIDLEPPSLPQKELSELKLHAIKKAKEYFLHLTKTLDELEKNETKHRLEL